MDATSEERHCATELEGFLRYVDKPARWSSPRLAGVKEAIAGYVRHQPDITLGEIGAALVGAGFTWTPDGKLAYEQRHVALIEEVEGLIEAHGYAMKAAELFL